MILSSLSSPRPSAGEDITHHWSCFRACYAIHSPIRSRYADFTRHLSSILKARLSSRHASPFVRGRPETRPVENNMDLLDTNWPDLKEANTQMSSYFRQTIRGVLVRWTRTFRLRFIYDTAREHGWYDAQRVFLCPRNLRKLIH